MAANTISSIMNASGHHHNHHIHHDHTIESFSEKWKRFEKCGVSFTTRRDLAVRTFRISCSYILNSVHVFWSKKAQRRRSFLLVDFAPQLREVSFVRCDSAYLEDCLTFDLIFFYKSKNWSISESRIWNAAQSAKQTPAPPPPLSTDSSDSSSAVSAGCIAGMHRAFQKKPNISSRALGL